jgi:hypothetical protein
MATEKRAPEGCRLNSEEDDNMMMKRAERHLDDSIVYLCALLADRPRLIDRYIDYFGETSRCARDADMGSQGGNP